jgi:hypothetical protein
MPTVTGLQLSRLYKVIAYWIRLVGFNSDKLLASSLNAQIAVEKGSIPEVADVSPVAITPASLPMTLPRSPQEPAELSTPEQSPPPGQPLKPDDDDDDWDDDDEVIITLAPGMK